MMRIDEPGWKRAAAFDSCERRSIWYRENDDGSIELCGGREGDDEYVMIAPGSEVTAEIVRGIEGVLRHNAWAVEQDCQAVTGLEEQDYYVGRDGTYRQCRSLTGEDTWKKCRSNMIEGRPWGCAEAELWEF